MTRSSCPRLHLQFPTSLMRSSGALDYSARLMLGFVVPEHEVAEAEPNANMNLGRTHASPDRGLDSTSLL